MRCGLWCFQGLRAGGGIGDVLEAATSYSTIYMNRLVFDMTFFVIVVVILLNVIFGASARASVSRIRLRAVA